MNMRAYSPPPRGAQIIYVDQAGNDTANGSQATPVRTLARAVSMMRPDRGDRVYLQYGQIYRETRPTMIPASIAANGAGIFVSGDSSKPKPQVIAGENQTAIACYAPNIGFMITGISLKPFAPKQTSEPKGISLGQQISNFTIDDVEINGFAANLNILNNTGGKSENIQIRNSKITNAAGNSEFSGQGIYAENVNNLIIENCIFDGNGNGPSVYRHGMYLSSHGVTNAQVRRTYVGHSAAFGVQLRGSGIVEDCIFEDNGVAVAFGGDYGYGYRNYVYGNHDAASNVLSTGISMNALHGHIQGNIIYDPNGQSYTGKYPGPGISLTPREWTPAGPRIARIFDNIVANWPGAPFQQNQGSDWDTLLMDNNIAMSPNHPLVIARSKINTASITRFYSDNPKATLDLAGSSGLAIPWLCQDFYPGIAFPKPDPNVDVLAFLRNLRALFPLPNLSSTLVASGSGA